MREAFTAYEYVERTPFWWLKDAGGESFDRNKILSNIIKACEKRRKYQKIEDIVASIGGMMRKYERIPSAVIGELIMEKLADVDDVAYVRFASVSSLKCKPVYERAKGYIR